MVGSWSTACWWYAQDRVDGSSLVVKSRFVVRALRRDLFDQRPTTSHAYDHEYVRYVPGGAPASLGGRRLRRRLSGGRGRGGGLALGGLRLCGRRGGRGRGWSNVNGAKRQVGAGRLVSRLRSQSGGSARPARQVEAGGALNGRAGPGAGRAATTRHPPRRVDRGGIGGRTRRASVVSRQARNRRGSWKTTILTSIAILASWQFGAKAASPARVRGNDAA